MQEAAVQNEIVIHVSWRKEFLRKLNEIHLNPSIALLGRFMHSNFPCFTIVICFISKDAFNNYFLLSNHFQICI